MGFETAIAFGEFGTAVCFGDLQFAIKVNSPKQTVIPKHRNFVSNIFNL